MSFHKITPVKNARKTAAQAAKPAPKKKVVKKTAVKRPVGGNR
ncbi:hypothetical protein [Streptomyces sp. NPDC059894]